MMLRKHTTLFLALLLSAAQGIAQEGFEKVTAHHKGGVIRGVNFNMSPEEVKELETEADEFYEYDDEKLRFTVYLGSKNNVADIYYTFDEAGLYEIIVETFLADDADADNWMASAAEHYTSSYGDATKYYDQHIWVVPKEVTGDVYKIKTKNISHPDDAGTRFEYIVSDADFSMDMLKLPEDDDADFPETDFEVSGKEYATIILAPDREQLFRGVYFNMKVDDVKNQESEFTYDGGSDNNYYISLDLVDGGDEFADIDYLFDDDGLYSISVETFMESEAAEERLYDELVIQYNKTMAVEPRYEESWVIWEGKDKKSKLKYEVGVRRLGYDNDSGVEMQIRCREITYASDLW